MAAAATPAPAQVPAPTPVPPAAAGPTPQDLADVRARVAAADNLADLKAAVGRLIELMTGG